MFNDEFLNSIRQALESNGSDPKLLEALNKITKGERLDSEQFQQVYEAIRKEGPPKMKYQDPDNWNSSTRLIP